METNQIQHEAQQSLPPLPDAEEIEILAGEALKLCERLDRVCNRMLYGQPVNSTVLHNAVGHLKLDTSTIRWWLKECREKFQTSSEPTAS